MDEKQTNELIQSELERDEEEMKKEDKLLISDISSNLEALVQD
jgi:hypothetical protein